MLAVIGLTSGQLDTVLAEHHFYQFWIGQVYSDWPDFDERKQEILQQIDTCVSQLDLKSEGLAEAFIEDDGDNGNPVRREEIADASQIGNSIGQLLFHRAYQALPIESDENGEAEVSLHFKLPGKRELNLYSWGDFWTDRLYRHPITDEIFAPTDQERFEIEAELKIELEVHSSDVDYQLTFEGRISDDNY